MVVLAIVQFLTLAAAIAGGALLALAVTGRERLEAALPLLVWCGGQFGVPIVYGIVLRGDSEIILGVSMIALEVLGGLFGCRAGVRAMAIYVKNSSRDTEL